MTPHELKEYLQVLKEVGVMSAQLKVAGDTLAVVFGPEPLLAGEPTTAGGWKGPDRLDAPQQYDEVP